MSIFPYNERHYRCFKNFLIYLNRDLFLISHYMDKYDVYSEFDDLDYLVMALEDRRFLRHCGFDFISLARESWKAILRKKHGGASTIDMQLVRTITGFKENTLFRKIYEIILSVLVNFKFSKKQIIKAYLRNAYFGSRLIGVERASLGVFSKYSFQLSYDEKAIIAAMLLRPKPLIPKQVWIESVMFRANYAKLARVFVKKSFY